MSERFWQWVMRQLSTKFIIFQWLLKSHIEENSGRKISDEEWKQFIKFFNEWYYEGEYDLPNTIMSQLSEVGDQVFLLFEQSQLEHNE